MNKSGKIGLAIGLLMIGEGILHAQNQLRGKVIDAQTHEALGGVKVWIKTHNRAAITNDSGQFIISIPPSDGGIIEISMLGYNTVTDTLTTWDNREKIYQLTPSISDIDAVVITASRMLQPIKNTPVLTQLLPVEQQLRMGNFTVTSTLEREVAGLDKTNFGYRPKLTFQGLGARYMLFLIDGERMAGEMDGDIDYYRLNLDNIDRIEILRGPASVVYGSNAISGVINLITRKPQAEFEAGTSLRYSKFNETSFNVYAGGNKNRFSYLSSFISNHTDGYDLTPNEPYSKNQERYTNVAFNQRFDYNISNHTTFTLKANAYYNRIYDGIVDVRAIDHGYAGQSIFAKIDHQFTDSIHSTWSYAMDRFVNYNILLNRNDKHNKTASDVLHTLRWLYDANTPWGHWTGGVEATYENLFSDKLSTPHVNLYTMAAFLQNDYRISSKYSVVTGTRAVYYSNGKYSMVPSVCFVIRHEPLIFRTSLGKGFRSPTLKEMYYYFDHQGMFQLLGNKNLKSERSNYVSTSLEYRENNINFGINAYYNYLSDMIYHTLVAEQTFQYININRARVMGVDWLSKWQPVRNLIFSFNASYINAVNLSTDSAMYNVAPFSATGSISYSWYFKKHWKVILDLSDKYTAARTYEPVGTLIYRDPAFHYWKFTSMLQYKNATLSIGIDNLFNKIMPYSLGNISPGRRFFFVINYHL
ncbi:MAG: TonB-dependent receptor, partial [Bacteroidales bacterium]